MELFDPPEGYDYGAFRFWIMPDPEAQQMIPYQGIVDAYNEVCCPPLAKVRMLTETRKRNIRARWKTKDKYQSLDWWTGFFSLVQQSDFLSGRLDDGRNWRASFDWLIKESNFVKVLEDQYANRRR